MRTIVILVDGDWQKVSEEGMDGRSSRRTVVRAHCVGIMGAYEGDIAEALVA